MTPEPIAIGTRRLGPGLPALIAAEVGLNHNGSFERAADMIAAAAKAGVDAVKFQNFLTEDFLSDRTLQYTYRSGGQTITESQWDMFKRYEGDRGWWRRLKKICDELEVIFFSTPTSEEGLRDLIDLEVAALKNGSDYLTHIPLLRLMGQTGIPVIVSTGMAVASDIDRAVAAVQEGSSPLVLLHCTSAYPTPASEVNLRRMCAIAERYRLPVGFSDHTEGWEAATQAVTLGACVVEKHFTLDRDLPGPDHWFSSTPAELAELVARVRDAESRLGRDVIEPADIERQGRQDYRLSVVAATALDAGVPLAAHMVALRRPGIGIHPGDLSRYLGRVLTRRVPPGAPLVPEDFSS